MPRMFKLKRWYCLTCLLALFVLTDSPTLLADINRSGFQVSAYGGVTNTDIDPGSLRLTGETDAIVPKNSEKQQINPGWGLGAAYRFVLPSPTETHDVVHDLSAGIDFFYFETVQHGQAWQYENPDYANYNYKLPLDSARLMLNGTVTFHPIGSHLFPFIEGGIGMARNTAKYRDTLVSGDLGGNVVFGQHTQNEFAYDVGAGIKLLLAPHVDISFRYLYTYLGDAATSNTANVPVSGPIKIDLSTQAWLLGITYSF